VLAALGWGALAASSLLIGVFLAFARRWPDLQLGIVLAFGAGALISAVSFELAQEGIDAGGLKATATGLAAGALTYYVMDGVIARRFSGERGMPGRKQSSDAGPALALGAFLDGVPEQLVLGIGLASGEPISIGLVVAIFVSNLPEAIGSATAMRAAGSPQRIIYKLWIAVAVVCVLASAAGYGLADSVSGEMRAGIDGFAAGALVVMLIDSMIPEAVSKAARVTGLVTALGFAVGVALSSLS